MPTEADLRDALKTIADGANSRVQSPVLEARMVEPHGRRGRLARRTAVAVAAMIVVVLAVTVALSTTRQTSHVPASATSSRDTPAPTYRAPAVFPSSEYVFDVAPVEGYQVSDGQASATMQWMNLIPISATGVPATITIYPARGFTPPRPANAVDVTVRGQPGFFGTIEAQPEDNGIAFRGALAWRYSADAWATVYSPSATAMGDDATGRKGTTLAPSVPGSRGLSERIALQVAEALRAGESHPVRAPARLATLPPNVVPNLQGVQVDRRQTTIVIGDESKGWFSTSTLRIQVSAGAAVPDEGDTGFGYTPVEFGAWHGAFYPDEDRLDVSNGTVGINIGTGIPHGVFTLAQLEATVEGMTFASDVGDPTTWFLAAHVLP